MIGRVVFAFWESDRRRGIERTGGRGQVEQFAECLRRIAIRLVASLRVALAHVELSVGCPVQAVQRVLDVAEVGEDAHVFVGRIVAIEVAGDGEVGRVRNPQVAPVPRETSDAIQAGRENLARVRDTVAVRVFQDDDAVRRRLRLGIAILRPHADAQPPERIEGHRAGIADERFLRKNADFESGGTAGRVGTSAS